MSDTTALETPAPDGSAAKKAGAKAARRKAEGRREILHYALRSKKILISSFILLSLILLAIFGPMIDRNDPQDYVGMAGGDSPTWNYLFGTTLYGQDVFAQFVNGLGPTFLVGLLGGGIAALIGMTIGFVAGYVGGILDEILNMFTNIMLVLPTLVLIIVISSFLPSETRDIRFEALFVGVTSWPWVARAIRAQTFSLRTREFVDLARMSGRSPWKIILQEIAPNMSSYLFMAYILLFGGAILIAATLDFVGLGPRTGWSLGLIMFKAQNDAALMLGLWWWFVPPGVGITLIVASLYIMNVGLDEIFNPKLRES